MKVYLNLPELLLNYSGYPLMTIVPKKNGKPAEMCSKGA